jgi:hypothetical protein
MHSQSVVCRFHRVDHVNCSGLLRGHGNFLLGRSPEHLPTSGLRLLSENKSFPALGQLPRYSPPGPIATNHSLFSALGAEHRLTLARVYAAFCVVHRDSPVAGGLPEPTPGDRFRILEVRYRVRKCLWKRLFSRHIYFRLKVASWMLCNLIHTSCASVRANPDPGGSDERAVCSIGTARTANRRTAFARL